MSDQSTTTGGAGAGQLPPDINSVGQPVQPQYITYEQAQRMAQEAAETAFRRAQGLIDKREQRVQDTLSSLQNALKLQRASGIEITPEQEKALQDKAILEAWKSPAQAPDLSKPAAQPVGDEPDTVTQIALGFEKRYGVEVYDEDPEARLIKADGTPDEYIETYISAIMAKRQRLQGQPQPVRTPTNLGQGGSQPQASRDLSDYRGMISRGLRGG